MMRATSRHPPPGRSSTSRIMPCETRKRDASGSGCEATSRSKVARSQCTYPRSGGFLRTMRFSFAGSPPAFCSMPQVLDHVLGRLRDDVALVVEALSPGAPRDLLEVAHAEDRGLLAVVLAQAREEHGADRDVHADAERVGPAHDREQPLLRELLDEQPVLRQAARRGEGRCRARGSASPPCRRASRSAARLSMRLGDRALLAPSAGESMLIRFCAVSAARALREVDDVDGGAPRPQELLNRLVQRRLAVLEVERHRALARAHRDGRTPRELRQRLLEGLGRPERRAHRAGTARARGRAAGSATRRRAPCRRSSETRR